MSDAAEPLQNESAKSALLAAAHALMAQDSGRFTIHAVCAEAGVSRAEFNALFGSRDALVAALEGPPGENESNQAQVQPPMTDAWLERRLRVFERALTALEAKAEASERRHARAIALLEERLAVAGAVAPVPTPLIVDAVQADPAPPARLALMTAAAHHHEEFSMPAAEPEPAAQTAPDDFTQLDFPEFDVAPETGMMLPPEATGSESFTREPMADFLANARQAARSAADDEPGPKDRTGMRLRWIAAGILVVVAVFGSVILVMGGRARATQAMQTGAGVIHRQLAVIPFNRLLALADSGDARAEARLAFAYLRGDGVASNTAAALRWASAAAAHGEPVAQYLLGTFYQQGQDKIGIAADPARAFQLFSSAASQGNIKAMHNLAIAYAEGLGTSKDEAQAAQWFNRAAEHGYVDSAFDLAVLYERGLGVKQSLKEALRWYSIAAMAGDHPSADRAAFLRHQVSPGEAVLAANSAASFAPLAPLSAANQL